MHTFEKVTDNILKLKVPFEDNYTSVFLVQTDMGDVLIDTATTEADVNDVILPALEAANAKVCAVFCTHLHGDHSGGLRFILPKLSNVTLYAYSERIEKLADMANVQCVKEGDILLSVLKVLHLPGHSSDSCALFDTRTNAVLTGDAVQQYGVSRYGCGVGLPSVYRDSLVRLLREPIDTLITSHPFVPHDYIARGREAVRTYLKEAIFDFDRVVEYTHAHADMGDPKLIADAFTEHYRKQIPNLPILQASTVKNILENK